MADKTNVPGVDNSGTFQSTQGGRAFSSNNKQKMDATNVPDMNGIPGQKSKHNVSSEKPLLGFLYSISKTPCGEYWPLYIGPNRIGRGRGVEICLEEGTVSSNHALLIIHRDDETGEVYAVIEDTGSSNGVKLNGKSIRFNRVECHNMDIIKIGNNYELLFILIDASAIGLKVVEDDMWVDTKASRKIISPVSGGHMGQSTQYSRISNPIDGGKTRATGDVGEVHGGTKTK